MKHEQELLARAMGHVDDGMILAAHKPHKKWRRAIPPLVAACLILAFLAVFPYLREIINTNSDLIGPGPSGDAGVNDGGAEGKPEEPPPYFDQAIPVELGGTTLTRLGTTETTVTFTLVKTDDTPVYAILYDRLGGALACTEPGYTDNGVVIRPNTLRIYVDGATEPVFELPTAPGTYEVVVDFTVIRNGTYPMKEFIGIYAYIGEDKQEDEPVTLKFDLSVTPETEAPGTEEESPAAESGDEPKT